MYIKTSTLLHSFLVSIINHHPISAIDLAQHLSSKPPKADRKAEMQLATILAFVLTSMAFATPNPAPVGEFPVLAVRQGKGGGCHCFPCGPGKTESWVLPSNAVPCWQLRLSCCVGATCARSEMKSGPANETAWICFEMKMGWDEERDGRHVELGLQAHS